MVISSVWNPKGICKKETSVEFLSLRLCHKIPLEKRGWVSLWAVMCGIPILTTWPRSAFWHAFGTSFAMFSAINHPFRMMDRGQVHKQTLGHLGDGFGSTDWRLLHFLHRLVLSPPDTLKNPTVLHSTNHTLKKRIEILNTYDSVYTYLRIHFYIGLLCFILSCC